MIRLAGLEAMGRLVIADEAQSLLLKHGIESRTRTAKGHVKIYFEAYGKKLLYCCGGSVSDYRALANVKSDLRRMLRQVSS